MSVRVSSDGATENLLGSFFLEKEYGCILVYECILRQAKKEGFPMVEMDIKEALETPLCQEKAADYLGHRRRLKEKYAASGIQALQDYELLELLLSFSIPHRDTKPYAKHLLSVFRNVRRILDADIQTLQTLGELPPQSALHFKAIGDLYRLIPREEFKRGRV